MKKKTLTKLIEQLPDTLDQINDVLDDQDIMMIDFMDGDLVYQIELTDVEGQYNMLDGMNCEISTVDIEHLLRNSLKK